MPQNGVKHAPLPVLQGHQHGLILAGAAVLSVVEGGGDDVYFDVGRIAEVGIELVGSVIVFVQTLDDGVLRIGPLEFEGVAGMVPGFYAALVHPEGRSEEHTSELQS